MSFRTRSTRLLAVAGVAGAALTASVPTTASAAPKVGIGDQNPAMLTNPLFDALGTVRYTRLIVPWNVMEDTTSPQYNRVSEFTAAAKAKRINVLIAFNHAVDQETRTGSTKGLPSVAAYTKQIKAFQKQFGKSVEGYQPWNEANSKTQPVFKKPDRLAQFTDAMIKNVKGEKIVGIDLQDTTNATTYFRRFYAKLKSKSKIKYWGLHNYSDTNRERTKGTDAFLKTTRKGEIWLTETGGQYHCCQPNSYNPGLEPDLERQADSLRFLFTRLVKRSSRIKRVYLYNFFGERPEAAFDAGLVNVDGTPRPAYDVANRYIK